MSAGSNFRKAVEREVPLQIVGAINAYCALLAERAMSAAAMRVYGAIRREGTQQAVIDQMQTRADLYDVLNYHAFEAKLDKLFAKRKNQ